MAFDKTQFRGLIVDVLKECDLFTPAAVELLMMTCAVESNFGTYIEQITGPALGVFQMEPKTHDDIWENYLKYKSNALPSIVRANSLVGFFKGYKPPAEDLRRSLSYAILMTRVHYLRVKEPLPNATNVEALARYWKKYYNTELGKGTVEEAIKKYEEYCV